MDPSDRQRKSLPPEIISSILSWLTEESVLKFKSVCKLWYQIITSDPLLITARFRRAPLQLIVQRPHGPSDVHPPTYWSSLRLDLIRNTTPTTENLYGIEKSLTLTFRGTLGGMGEPVFTCCDGLLYIHPNQYAFGNPGDCGYVCNPLTGELVNVPLSQKILQGIVFGFFFHKASNQYRLLRSSTQSIARRRVTYPPCTYEIISLGTKSWRSILCSTPYRPNVFESPAVFNNALYWVSRTARFIVVFHMDAENFQLMEPPQGPEDISMLRSYIIEVEGSLCFCEDDKKEVEIWILHEGLWEKKYVFSYKTPTMWSSTSHRDMNLGKLVCFLDGEFVFTHCSYDLVYYNPTFNSLRRVSLRSQDILWTACIYKRSLFSLKNLQETSKNFSISILKT